MTITTNSKNGAAFISSIETHDMLFRITTKLHRAEKKWFSIVTVVKQNGVLLEKEREFTMHTLTHEAKKERVSELHQRICDRYHK